MLQHGKAITDLKRQVKFSLKANRKHICFLIVDYAYNENGRPVVEDYKGGATLKLPAFVIKKKLFEANYPEYEFRISQRRGP